MSPEQFKVLHTATFILTAIPCPKVFNHCLFPTYLLSSLLFSSLLSSLHLLCCICEHLLRQPCLLAVFGGVTKPSELHTTPLSTRADNRQHIHSISTSFHCQRGNQIHILAEMAVNIPPSPAGKQDLRIPPLLHTRSGNEFYDRPETPTQCGFTSPFSTPQGSPSKNRLPPGATDLPSVFDHAMKLTPSSPSKSAFNAPSLSPGKGAMLGGNEDLPSFSESVIHSKDNANQARKSNKENTPPGALRFGREPVVNTNQAAMSRQEPYQTKEASRRGGQSHLRGLTAEELEKLQLPNVKRLANVTQLCQFNAFYIY